MFLLIRVTNLAQGERKNKFYLSFSEPQPKFCLCEAQTKVMQTERNIKSQCLRSTRSRTSEDIEKATNNKTFLHLFYENFMDFALRLSFSLCI